jgi:hypothetical protein
VDRVNGVTPQGQVFRSPFWSGLTLSGANLDLVTWVELEDWGADTVDGTPEGVQSIPTARQVTLPTGSGGPTIHFQQSSTTLTVDAASLEFQGAFDLRFETRHWLKVRVHYTASGVDRSILADVTVSLTDLVSQGLPPPSITGVATYETVSAAAYDPATGLLSMFGDDPTRWSVLPSSVMSPDLQREFPVLRVAPEGLYLPRGLNPRQVGAVVFPYDPAVSGALKAGRHFIVLGSDLWDDGPLRLTDASGNTLGEIPIIQSAGDKIVASVPLTVKSRFAFLEFASMRGVARTPWIMEFTGTPSLLRIELGQLSVDLQNQGGWPQFSDWKLPVGVVLTVIGKWLGNFDQAEFEGPAYTWVPPCHWQMASEPLTRVYQTPGPNQFRVVDDEHIELRIDADPATDRALRRAVYYCDCEGWCSDWGANSHKRRITFSSSVDHDSYDSFEMNPASGYENLMAKCESPDDDHDPDVPPDDPPPDPLPPGPGDCTNTICG